MFINIKTYLITVLFCLIWACNTNIKDTSRGQQILIPTNVSKSMDTTQVDTATFGGGCFWCTEAIFLEVEGVIKVEPGYAGGQTTNPTYQEVCTGKTGHAEVIQIIYDPSTVSYATLLAVFFKTHDPTTLNKQGADEGTQYRSVIFYHNAEQKRIASEVFKKISDEKVYPAPIVTEISPLSNYSTAEDYHLNYYNRNPNQGYCRFVIQPKIEKFNKIFSNLKKH